ncbi:hypothetical protein ACVIGB_008679 [Bradyrhizobium sp. USDA 4341]
MKRRHQNPWLGLQAPADSSGRSGSIADASIFAAFFAVEIYNNINSYIKVLAAGFAGLFAALAGQKISLGHSCFRANGPEFARSIGPRMIL